MIPTSMNLCRWILAVMLSLSLIAPGLHAQEQKPPPGPNPAETTGPHSSSRPWRVVVSIAPLRGLVQPLLPGGSTVDVLIPPGVSEHGYEIPPAKLVALTQADLVITIGLGLEPQIDKFLTNNPRDGRLSLAMADLVEIKSEPAAGDHAGHKHGPDGECLHGPTDPHIWLDPVLARKFVETLAPKLAAKAPLPEPAATGEVSEHPVLAAAKRLGARIDAVDAAYRAVTDAAETRTLVVGHDAYGWLSQRYSLKTVPIAGLNAQEPTNKAVQAAIAAVRLRGAKAVFVEPQLSQAAGKRIADRTKVPVLLLDPLGDGDWVRMMEANLESLKQGLGQKAAKRE